MGEPVGVAHVRSALIALLLPLAVQAHEIGTTQVRLAVRGTTWTASITTAPQSLLNKLEAAAHLQRSSGLTGDAYRSRLTPLLVYVAKATDVRVSAGARAGMPAPHEKKIFIARLEQPNDATRPAFIVLDVSGTLPADARSITFSYSLSYSTYALTFGNTTRWIEADDVSAPLPLAPTVAPSRLAIIKQYLVLGFEHILPRGLDHILFILGIFLLTTKLRPILAQVTAFTVAHSITLGLTMYGLVSLPSRVVEPLIALSIAYVAIENVVTSELKPWRPAVVFAFGLLHGMGFAGVLRQLQLPRGEFIPALVSFNVGIELAQLAVIGIAFVMIAVWFRERDWYRPRFVVPASMAIAATGMLWTVQRIVG